MTTQLTSAEIVKIITKGLEERKPYTEIAKDINTNPKIVSKFVEAYRLAGHKPPPKSAEPKKRGGPEIKYRAGYQEQLEEIKKMAAKNIPMIRMTDNPKVTMDVKTIKKTIINEKIPYTIKMGQRKKQDYDTR